MQRGIPNDKLKFRDFADRIDVDALEEALGFEPQDRDNGNDIGTCPLPFGQHKNGDTTGKFAIHRDKRIFNCWVCGGGNFLSLAMAVMDLDEQSAIEWLYQFTAPEDQTDDDFENEIARLLNVAQKKSAALPYFNENVLLKWEGGTDEWCEERGINADVAKRYRVGFNREAVRKSSKGDHRGPAIILPHFWRNRLVGWQHRWLDEIPKHIPKYTNTSDFPKAKTLFNYEQVYLATEPIVVVESVPTALFLTSLGIPAVATFGSSVTDEQMRLLRKCQQGLILAFDNDPPGFKWIDGEDSLYNYLERYVVVKVCEPVGEYPNGDDLGDLVRDRDAVPNRVRLAQTI